MRASGQLVPLAGEPSAIFHTVSIRAVYTARDAWVYNSSEPALRRNIGEMIEFYNDQVDAFTTKAQHHCDQERAGCRGRCVRR